LLSLARARLVPVRVVRTLQRLITAILTSGTLGMLAVQLVTASPIVAMTILATLSARLCPVRMGVMCGRCSTRLTFLSLFRRASSTAMLFLATLPMIMCTVLRT
jgi:hypothetical protein